VTGVDDPVLDGDVAYTIVTAPAASADPSYNGLDAADVAVTNTDDEMVGITVTPVAGLTTTEAGGTATFTVRLGSQPPADVTIGLASSDTTEGTVSVSSLMFTDSAGAAPWDQPQTVTVTGADDAVVDGGVPYMVVLGPSTSTDPDYTGINPDDVAVT